MLSDDFLWRQLKGVPAFRALLRAVESRFYQDLPLTQPVLDLGCGDGHFAQQTFIDTPPPLVGIDPWWEPLQEAQGRHVYGLAVQSSGGRLPFADNTFGSVVSNSVLEHIPDVEAVVKEAARVLASPGLESGQPGGLLVITAPSEYFTAFLSISMALRRIGLDKAASAYESWFNKISRHHHCDSPAVWHQRLAQAGLRTIRWQYYFSPAAHARLEWGHLFGLPSLVTRWFFGRWILAPWRSSLEPVEQWLRPAYDEEFPKRGAYLLFIARKVAPGETGGPLPPPEPLQIKRHAEEDTFEQILESDLVQHGIEEPAAAPDISEVIHPPAVQVDSYSEKQEIKPLVDSGPPVRSLLWLAAAMILAFFGQVGWNWQKRPMQPSDGLTWYVLAAAAFFVFMWQTQHQGRRRAKDLISAIDVGWIRRHTTQLVLVLAGLSLSFIAWRQANRLVAPNSVPVLATWLIGICLGTFALWPGFVNRVRRLVSSLAGQKSRADDPHPSAGRTKTWDLREIAVVAGLVLLAFTLRYYQLTNIPYVLSGDEANMGSEALRVLNGQLVNPFATGWFSHPTLYFFLLAIPVKIFGNTTFALRFFSPFVGALTVFATYLFARRWWGRSVALAAGLILAGYHFHIHFSRLALNNIWDPLFALLVLGLLCQGWESKDKRFFVAAGLGLGLSQYFYMGARMLLILIGALLLYWLVCDRRRLWELRGGMVSMFLIALIVSLPIVLCSLQHPDEYMARMNQLGIFPSGWLDREVKVTGASRTAILTQQLWKSALAFNYTTDPTFWYRPNIPLLRFWPSILFVFGLLLTAGRIKKTNHFLLLLWIGATIFFAGFLLENPPSSQRYVIAAPAVAILVALAMVWMFKQAQELLGGRREVWTAGLLLAVLLISWGDVSFYFNEYTPTSDFGGLNTEVAQRVSDYLTDLGPGWEAYFFGLPRMGIGERGGFPTVSFLVSQVRRIDIDEQLADPGDLAGLHLPAVFIFLPERAAELQMIEDAFPGGQEKLFPGRFERVLFISYEVE